MASDRDKFMQATAKWENLARDRRFSLPPTLGYTAILYSLYYAVDTDSELFAYEANDLQKQLTMQGRKVTVFREADSDDMHTVLADPAFSDVITIGHGGLGHIFMEKNDDATGASSMGHYDWRDTSRHATHLKLGKFTQRQCGVMHRILNAPMGMFAVARHSDVIAAVGQNFSPASLDDPVNDLLKPVTRATKLSYHDVQTYFPMQDFEEVSRRMSMRRRVLLL